MDFPANFSNARRLKPVIARAIACGVMLLILPSCVIPELRRAEPAPALPDNFAGVASAENSALLGIEEFYHDPTLTSLIEQALAGNRELKLLEQEVRLANYEVLSRTGAYLPFLTVGPTVGILRQSNRAIEGAALRDDEYLPGRFFMNPHGILQGGVNLTWQIDIYRQLRNARDAAALRYASAIERRNYFVTTLVAEVAEKYYALMALDMRLDNLNQIIALQESSLKIARARKEGARGNQLGVLRFEASVQFNQSEKLIVNQDIIIAENRINFLLYRYPQRVDRDSSKYYDLTISLLNVGVPSQLLQNRPDVRQAERFLAAAGLDVSVARVNFYPQLILNGGVGLEAYRFANLFNPQAVAGMLASGFIGPLVNFRAIQADYLSANARQIQAVYEYQRTLLSAFTEVVNRLTRVQNYSNSVLIKKQQLTTLTEAVSVAETLFQNARTEYLDVLTAQQELRDARLALIDVKEQQLIAIVNAYQALGGGDLLARSPRGRYFAQIPYTHTVRPGETFVTLSHLYYKSGRFHRALWAANKKNFPHPERLAAGDKVVIPWVEELDASLFDKGPGPELPPGSAPLVTPPPTLTPTPPPADTPSPFAAEDAKNPALDAARIGIPPAPTPMPAADR